jgi:hypothetical protein
MECFLRDAESVREAQKEVLADFHRHLSEIAGECCIRWTDAAFSALKLARDFSTGSGH